MVDTHTSNPTGDAGYWSDANTWSSTGGGIPTAGDSVVIATGDTVYYDVAIADQVSLAALTVTGTLRFCTAATPAGQLNSVSPSSRTGLGLLMADAVSIAGAGALYVGNSTTDYIARPTAAATYAPNVTITLGTTGQITVTTQRYYGWIPAAPAAHPAWTSIVGSDVGDDTPPLATETKIRVADATFDVRQGEQILIGVGGTNGVMAEANKGLYTCNAAPASSVITLSTAGGLVTNRIVGDYVSVYSRPILITKPAANAAANTVASGIMQGVRINLMPWTSGAGWTFTGCTLTDANNGYYFTSTSGGNTYTDCVANYASAINIGGLITTVFNNLFSGCADFNCTNTAYGTHSSVLINCVHENAGGAMVFYGINTRFIGCHVIASTTGFSNVGSGERYWNCTSSGCNATYGDITNISGLTKLYNCTFTTGAGLAAITGYTGSYTPNFGGAQARDHADTAGYRAVWCRGGTGTTNQTTVYLNSIAYGTMKFTTDGTYYAQPTFFDTPFWLPANKSLSFVVPMYCTTGQTVTAEVWVISPNNDPLFFDPLWTLTPSTGSTQGLPTATYVVARKAMPTPDSTWHYVTVDIPAASTPRELVARIIVKSTSASQLCYAYLNSMEAALEHKKKIVI